MLILDMSKNRISVLGDVSGEEHLLLRRHFWAATASILLFALTLFPYCSRHQAAILPHIDPFLQEDSTLSQRKVGMPEFNELIDMARLLVNLWEAAQRLPEGSERRGGFRKITGFS